MNQINPYTNKESRKIVAPPIFKMPIFSFDSANEAIEQAELGELLIAKVPNTRDKYGVAHHVSLLYKDEDGNSYDMLLVQHNPTLKPGTEEHFAKKNKKPVKKKAVKKKVKNGGK